MNATHNPRTTGTAHRGSFLPEGSNASVTTLALSGRLSTRLYSVDSLDALKALVTPRTRAVAVTDGAVTWYFRGRA